MKVVAGTHLLGSSAGYTTLAASPDVNAAEQQELSVLGFGQSSDRAFLESLETSPSAYGRLLRSGRFAITRCFRGEMDDAGRPTLRLCSIVLSKSDYELLARSGLKMLLCDTTVWAPGHFENGLSVTIMSRPEDTDRVVTGSDLLAMDAWLGSLTDSDSLSTFGDDSLASEAILSLPQVLATEDRLRYRWGVRLLGTGVAVDVCTLATGASRSGRRRINTYQGGNRLKHPGIVHLASCLGQHMKQLPPARTILPETLISGADSPRRNSVGTKSNPMNRQRLVRVSAIVTLALSILFAVILVISSANRRNIALVQSADTETPTSAETGQIVPEESSNDAVPPRLIGEEDAPHVQSSNGLQQPPLINATNEFESPPQPATAPDHPVVNDSQTSVIPRDPPVIAPVPSARSSINRVPQPVPAEPPAKRENPKSEADPLEDAAAIVDNGLEPIGSKPLEEYFENYFAPYVASAVRLNGHLADLEAKREDHDRKNPAHPEAISQALLKLRKQRASWESTLAEKMPAIVQELNKTLDADVNKKLRNPIFDGKTLDDLEHDAKLANVIVSRLTTYCDACTLVEDTVRSQCKCKEMEVSYDNFKDAQHLRSKRIERLKKDNK